MDRMPWELREAQEIFSGVVGYLRSRTEGRAGRVYAGGDGFVCLYMSDCGPCAVGWLLSPDDWREGVDPRTVVGSVQWLAADLRPEAWERLRPHLVLLARLQDIHDDDRSWVDGKLSETGETRLREIAERFGLAMP